ncbi:hypothetical protein GALL_165630 [mine drainage metagenome]|uniref:DUF3945 domain-containing protein n=1 Tax=mine drainage metagenome TaxID=410659 RepID=A0A1J5RZZ1_9ZZZZ
MAYNGSLYFIDVKDVHFFKEKQEALDFVIDNYSDHDRFNTIQVDSVEDVLRKVRYSDIFNEEKIQYVTAQKENNISSSLNQTKMNTENQTYLKDNIKYMGFGENMHAELEQNMKEGKADFQLHYKAEINKKPFEAVLHFRKSENSEMYFFNRYEASLERKNGEKLNQTFYLNKGKGVTAKEAYNLLEGRAVYKELANKEGEPYKAWIQLDFDKKDKHQNHEVKQYHDNYGYDVKAAVSKYAVAELDGGEKEKALLQSLQKGNIQSVTIEKDGATHKMFIEANPQYKTVTLYDGQMKIVQKEALQQYIQQKQSNGKEVKQIPKEDQKVSEKKSRRNRQKVA